MRKSICLKQGRYTENKFLEDCKELGERNNSFRRQKFILHR